MDQQYNQHVKSKNTDKIFERMKQHDEPLDRVFPRTDAALLHEEQTELLDDILKELKKFNGYLAIMAKVMTDFAEKQPKVIKKGKNNV